MSTHQSPIRGERPVSTEHVTGPRLAWRPAPKDHLGYVCDSTILGKRMAYFALGERLVLVHEWVVQRLAERYDEVGYQYLLGTPGALASVVEALIAEHEQARAAERATPRSPAPVQHLAPADEPKPEAVVYTADSAKNLADGVSRYPEFVESLRDPSMGHKAVAERFPFTSESSVRRWRKAEGVGVAR